MTSAKADRHPLGSSRWPTCPPKLGRSIEKDHPFNMDAQDAQDYQDGRLLHDLQSLKYKLLIIIDLLWESPL